MPAKYKYIINEGLGDEFTLKDEPLNWQALSLNRQRSTDYKGLFKRFSGDLEFHGDGADFISAAKNTKGLYADVFVNIYLFDYTDYTYKQIFTGKINFDNYTEAWSDQNLFTVTTNLEPTSFEQKILNGDNVPVNVYQLVDREGNSITPFTNFEKINPTIDGHDILRGFKGIKGDVDFGSYQAVVGREVTDGTRLAWGHWDLQEDAFDNSPLNNFQFYPTQIVDNEPVNTKKFFFRVQESGKYTLSWFLDYTIVLTLGNSGTEIINDITTTVKLQRNSTVIVEDSLSGNGTTTVELNHEYSDSVEVDLFVGDEVYFFTEISWNVNDTDDNDVFVDVFSNKTNGHTFDISVISQFRSTNIQGMFPWEASNRIVEFLTGVPLAVDSQIFSRTDQDDAPANADGPASKVALFVGTDIRTAPDNEKGLTFTLRQLYDTFNALFNIGLAIDETDINNPKLIIDEVNRFYDSSTLIKTVTEIKQSQKSFNTSDMFSNIKIGFLKYKIEDRGFKSIEEFNTEHDYASQAAILNNTLTLIAPFIGGSYPIEYMRRNQWDYTSDNNDEKRFDDEVFMMCLQRTADLDLPLTSKFTRFFPSLSTYWNEASFTSDQIFRGTNSSILANEIIWAPPQDRNEPAAGIIAEAQIPSDINNPGIYVHGDLIKLIPQAKSYTATIDIDIQFTSDSNLIDPAIGTVDVGIRKIVGGVITDDFQQTYDAGVQGFQNFSISLNEVVNMSSTSDIVEYYIVVDWSSFDPGLLGVGARHELRTSGLFNDFDAVVVNDSFADWVQESPQAYFGDGVNITGITSPDTALNYRLSPRQSIERHLKTLNQINDKAERQLLTFQDGELNTTVETTNPNFKENEDVPTTTGSLWGNDILEVETPWEYSDDALVAANPFGVIRVLTPNVDFEGYIENVDWNVEESTALLRLRSTAALLLPGVPEILQVVPFSSNPTSTLAISLTEANDPLGQGYRWYISNSQNGTYTAFGESPINVGFKISQGLSPGTTYWYKVTAFNSNGESEMSAAMSGTTTG